MNGHVIVPNLIAVDYWKENAVAYFFLTHCHGDHVSPRLRRWQKKIYTSKLNCQILQLMYDIPEHLLVPLPLGETLGVGQGDSSFQVTALDARHCPGSIVLLFQGRFGSILYTGDLRYWPGLLEAPAMRYVLRSGGGLDQLYLDNTYCSPECVFPPRQNVLEDVIKYLRECGDCDICIGMRDLGKESAVIAIAEALQTRVHVSPSRLRLLQLCAPSAVWTTEEAAARLHVVPFRQIGQYGGRTGGERPTVALLLTALFVGWQGPAPYSGGRVQVFPYGDHSSFPELCELVRRVRPRRVLPLVKRWATRGWFAHRDLSCRCDMAVFRTYLRGDTPPQPRLEADTPMEREQEPPNRMQPEPETEHRLEQDREVERRIEPVPVQEAGQEAVQEPVQEAVQEPVQERAQEPIQESVEEVARFLASEQGRESERRRQVPGRTGGPVCAPSRNTPPPPSSRQPAASPGLDGSHRGAGSSAADSERPNGARPAAPAPQTHPERPCPFTMVAGQLVRLDQVLYTERDVDRWLSVTGPVTSGEITSSCD